MKKITRRDFFNTSLSAAGAVTLASCSSNGGSLLNEDLEAPTYVLVHGAWHGGWCWREVATALRNTGAKVFTPTLTGLGKREHLVALHEVGLQTHIDDVVNLIEYEELENVVLVGHSYAGMVITGVADTITDKISELVYLDALVPLNGGSLIDVDNVMTEEQVRASVASIKSDQPGMLPIAPLEFLGIEESDPKAKWVQRRMTPHPVKTIADRLTFDTAVNDALKKTYILCAQQQRPEENMARVLSRVKQPNWRLIELAAGHDAMVTEPEKLADLLVGLSS